MQRLTIIFLTSLIVLCTLPLVVLTQERTSKPTPRQFDEYKDYDETRLARFARQLKREPTTQAYIIAYSKRRRPFNNSFRGAELPLQWAKTDLVEVRGIKPSRVVTVDGGLREEEIMELWIVPRGAPAPAPRPTAQPDEVVYCPHVSVSGDMYALRGNKPLKFTAYVNSADPKANITLNWTVSAGRITSGQGTDTITVEVPESEYKKTTATVELSGLSDECANKASDTTVVGIVPYKVFELEEFGGEGLQTRLDYLAGFLLNEPSLLGYIIVYGGRDERRSEVQFRVDSSRDYLVSSRGITPDRFRVIKGGYREKTTIEIWLSTREKPAPIPTPTVDEKYVTFRRGKPRV